MRQRQFHSNVSPSAATTSDFGGAFRTTALWKLVAPVSRPAVGADSSPHLASACANVDDPATAGLETGATPVRQISGAIDPPRGRATLWCMLFCLCLLAPLTLPAQTVTATVPAGYLPQATAINPVTNKIYIANKGSNTVTVIDGATNSTSYVYVGYYPYAVAINSVTDKIYVANNGSGNVTVIDGASNNTSSVNVGSMPRAVAVDPATNKIYVANYGSNTVTVIDGASNNTSAVNVGISPLAVAVNPVTNKIYVANGGATVTVIDGASSNTSTVNVGSYPLAVAVNPVTNKIYVANSYGNTVTVIDGASNNTSTVTAGGYPFAVAINPVTNKIYVANSASNTVTVIDGATNNPTSIAAGSQPVAVAVNPVTNKIYVANSYGNTVTAIDGASNATSTVNVGYNPDAVAVNPVTNKIYTANSGSGNVSVIDGAVNATSTIGVGSYPQAEAVNPVTNKIYVVNEGDNDVSVIDGATNNTTNVNVGSEPNAVAINPVTNKIYVTNRSYYSNTITVIDGATNNTTNVNVGSEPAAVAVNPVTNKIYVANNNSGTVTVIDGATNNSTSVSVGSNPCAVAVDPVTDKIYVANSNSGTVTVIDGPTNNTTSVSVGSNPCAVAVDPVTDKIYVANNGGSSVTVIDGATDNTTNVYVGSEPIAVAINSTTNNIYVANNGGNSVTVIDGATYNTTNVYVQSEPTAVAVNPATNKIYVANLNSNSVTVIDGATNVTSTIGIGAEPTALAVNPITNKTYIASDGYYYWYGYVTVLTEQQVQAIPLVTTISALPGGVTSETNPSFNFTVSDSFSPFAPAVENVYYQLDSWQGPWLSATGTAPNFSAQLSPLAQGSHILYAWASDGTDASELASAQTAIGAITAYPFTVATPTFQLNCPEVTYDGKPHSCTGVVMDSGADSPSASWSVSPASETNAGSYTVTATLTSNDPNFTNVTATGTLIIDTIKPLAALTCPSVTYDGKAHSCTGSLSGSVAGEAGGSWSISPAGESNAGTYTVTGTFTSSDPNFASGTATGTMVIALAYPSVQLNCPNVPYDGNLHSCSPTATGVDGTAVWGSWSLDPASEINAGWSWEEGTFTSYDSNYHNSWTDDYLIIQMASQIIICPTSPVTYSATPAAFCTTNFGQPVTYLTVSGAASINPSNPNTLILSATPGTVTITAASAPGEENYYGAYLPQYLPQGIQQSVVQFTTVPAAAAIHCTYTPAVSATNQMSPSLSLPSTATYGDSGAFACTSNSSMPLTYTIGAGLKSTLVSGVLTFNAAEKVTLKVTQAAGNGYMAASWPPASVTNPLLTYGYYTAVAPRPLTLQVASQPWTYGSTQPAYSVTPTGLINGDQPANLTYYETDVNGHPVILGPTSPLGGYTVNVKAGMPNYKVTSLPGTYTYQLNTATGLVMSPASGTAESFADTLMHGVSSTILTVTFTNSTGASMLIFKPVLLSGKDFFVVNTASASVPTCSASRGKLCTYKVYFKPAEAGALSDTLSFTVTDADNTAGFTDPGSAGWNPTETLTLGGPGIGALTASTPIFPNTHDLSTNTQMVTLTNSTTWPVTITSMSSSNSYLIVDSSTTDGLNTCLKPLPIGGACNIPVTFAPLAGEATIKAANLYSGKLTIQATAATNDATADSLPTINVPLNAIDIPWTISGVVTTRFPLTTVGQSSATAGVVTVTNTSGLPLAVSAAAPSTAYFTVATDKTNTCFGTGASATPAGGSCVIPMTFSPVGGGAATDTYSAKLVITATVTPAAAGSTAVPVAIAAVSLTATDIPWISYTPAPSTRTTPVTLTFAGGGTTTPATQTITVVNNSDKGLAMAPFFSGVTATPGAVAYPFAILSNTCKGRTGGPGQTCTITITSTLLTGGTASGALTINDGITPSVSYLLSATNTANASD